MVLIYNGKPEGRQSGGTVPFTYWRESEFLCLGKLANYSSHIVVFAITVCSYYGLSQRSRSWHRNVYIMYRYCIAVLAASIPLSHFTPETHSRESWQIFAGGLLNTKSRWHEMQNRWPVVKDYIVGRELRRVDFFGCILAEILDFFTLNTQILQLQTVAVSWDFLDFDMILSNSFHIYI
jgi:hypothetical protein